MRQPSFLIGFGLVATAWLFAFAGCKTNKQNMEISKGSGTATGTGTGAAEANAGGAAGGGTAGGGIEPAEPVVPESAEPTIGAAEAGQDPAAGEDPTAAQPGVDPAASGDPASGTPADPNADPSDTTAGSIGPPPGSDTTNTNTGTNGGVTGTLPPMASNGQPSSNNQLVLALIQKLLAFAGIGGGGTQGLFAGNQNNNPNAGNQGNQNPIDPTDPTQQPDPDADPNADTTKPGAAGNPPPVPDTSGGQ